MKEYKSQIVALLSLSFLLSGSFAFGIDINQTAQNTLKKSESFLMDVKKINQENTFDSNISKDYKSFKIVTTPMPPYEIPVTITFTSNPSVPTGYWYINGVFMGMGKSFNYTFKDIAKYTIELRKRRDMPAIAKKSINILNAKKHKMNIKELFSKLPSLKTKQAENRDITKEKIANMTIKPIKLWGEQNRDFEKGITQINGNSITLEKRAIISQIDIYPVNFQTIDKNRGFCIWKSATPKKSSYPILCGGIDKATLVGKFLKKGSYTLLPDIGLHIEILLEDSNSKSISSHNVETNTIGKSHDIEKTQ